MTTAVTNKPLPLPFWARCLLTLVVLGFLAIVVSSISLLVYLQKISIDSTNPQSIQKSALKIAQFQEPLPDGYNFQLGVDFLSLLDLVAIDHKADHQQIYLYCLQGALAANNDADTVLSHAYELGINTMSTSGKFQELKSSGVEKIGGLSMPYRIGQYQDQNGKTALGLVGCICVNKPAKNILIYSYPGPGNAYNQDVSMKLLKSIKGF